MDQLEGPRESAGVRCVGCGYDLTSIAIGGRCPECGMPVTRSFQRRMAGPTSGKSVASLVLGICSIVGCFLFGVPSLVCGPLAIVFWKLASDEIQRGDAAEHSLGVATAGLVLGIIGTMLGAVPLGILVLGMIGAA